LFLVHSEKTERTLKVKLGKGELLPFLTTHVACGLLVTTGVKIDLKYAYFYKKYIVGRISLCY